MAANPLEATPISDEPVVLDPVAREGAAWDRYMALTARWGVSFEPATDQTAQIGTLINHLGSILQAEPDLGWQYAELVRQFVAFSDQFATHAETFEATLKTAEREWRRALDAVAEPERGWIAARRAVQRQDIQFEAELDEE